MEIHCLYNNILDLLIASKFLATVIYAFKLMLDFLKTIKIMEIIDKMINTLKENFSSIRND